MSEDLHHAPGHRRSREDPRSDLCDPANHPGSAPSEGHHPAHRRPAVRTRVHQSGGPPTHSVPGAWSSSHSSSTVKCRGDVAAVTPKSRPLERTLTLGPRRLPEQPRAEPSGSSRPKRTYEVPLDMPFHISQQTPAAVEGIGLVATVSIVSFWTRRWRSSSLALARWDRTGARYLPHDRSVPPARPPNRRCDFHCVRLSTNPCRTMQRPRSFPPTMRDRRPAIAGHRHRSTVEQCFAVVLRSPALFK